MHYWLVKQEPEAYSWDDLVRDGKTAWEGVRNYQARNNLQKMKRGDSVLFYHSVGPREVVGVAEVTREAFPDETAEDPSWVAVEIKPLRPLPRPVSLDRIKEETSLKDIPLIKQSRLSVMPLTEKEFQTILQIGR
jgi:predicted RNA-binding protein with PUA-like domain